MRRGSLKKSSNFKIQAEKNVFKAFINDIDECKTVRMYPHLKDIILKTSQTINDYCYSFSDQSPFLKGLNYANRNYGFSTSSSGISYREWLPNVQEAYLMGQFNNYNQNSHRLEQVEDEQSIFEITIEERQKLIEESKILLRIIDKEGKQLKIAPPSCQTKSKNEGVFCLDMSIQKNKQSKKQEILLAYTLDLNEVSLNQAEDWIEQNVKNISDFNTIIIRNLFESGTVLKKSCLEIEKMKKFYDLINCIKQKLGFKILIEWVFQQSFQKEPQNPIERGLLKKNEKGDWEYNFSDKEVMGFYLSKISYYLSTFQIDGFHFKEIDTVFHSQEGQILLKCINILHYRLLDHSFALASCKKQIPGMNQPILEGGLGFSFTYNYGQDFISSQSRKQLKEKFDNILKSSNCVPIDLNKMDQKHLLNFLFAVFVSQKGIFCRGTTQEHSDLLKKVLKIRKQFELFGSPAEIEKINEKIVYIRRENTIILFNFDNSEISETIQNIENMELVYSYGEQAKILENLIQLPRLSCSILEDTTG